MSFRQYEAWKAAGVVMPSTEALEVGEEVRENAVGAGTVLHAGTKIFGETTSIGPGCELGREAPATVEDCQLGAKVQLKGGSFVGSVFLDGAAMGSGAQVREGCLLEEGAEMAHTVGLKQTIFFPYVVGGSLINFCDALMAGGTSRKRHSEIGSSFVHFNYTPRGDKATASMFGDVPRGVMLGQDPIFLGGQGGVVGPARVEYGTVLPAGNVLRGDVLEGGMMVLPKALPAGAVPFSREYRSVRRVYKNCAIYIGNVAALEAWYDAVRKPLMDDGAWGSACFAGAKRVLASVRKERVKRLAAVMSAAAEQGAAGALPPDAWVEAKARLGGAGDEGGAEKEAFLAAWEATAGAGGYLARVAALDAAGKASGTAWLQGIVARVSGF